MMASTRRALASCGPVYGWPSIWTVFRGFGSVGQMGRGAPLILDSRRSTLEIAKPSLSSIANVNAAPLALTGDPQSLGRGST